MTYIEGQTLEKYFKTTKKDKKERIEFELGCTIALINNLEIKVKPKVFDSNICWGKYFRVKLLERLNPLVNEDILSDSEKNIIIQKYDSLDVDNKTSLLHLDVRHQNVIYDENRVYLIDAEHCDVSDPLYELAIASVSGVMTKFFLEGYMSRTKFKLDLDSVLYKFYKMERQAGLVNLFKNIVKNEEYFGVAIRSFNNTMEDILRS
jgi:thiamine kinase-like enzyme